MNAALPTPGASLAVAYPFVRAKVEDFTDDGPVEIDTWNPGVRFENTTPGDVECFADGVGEMVLTVVGTFKPGRFPTRVFYTRAWRTPDGKEFGKPRLHIATADKFRRISGGYRHPYSLTDPEG